jgi:hypothetical protein
MRPQRRSGETDTLSEKSPFGESYGRFSANAVVDEQDQSNQEPSQWGERLHFTLISKGGTHRIRDFPGFLGEL